MQLEHSRAAASSAALADPEPWRFMPCGRVGGDLFNFCPLGDSDLAVFVIDVSGHGVPAAMVTVSLSQFLSPRRLLASPAPADGAT